jgi:Uma2 family endonuclease
VWVFWDNLKYWQLLKNAFCLLEFTFIVYICSKITNMENVDKVEEPPVEYGIEYTYADYLKFDFEEMVELIRGRIFRMSLSQRTSHQLILGRLLLPIFTYCKSKSYQIFHGPVDVVLPIGNKKRDASTTVVQPDLLVLCDRNAVEEAAIFGVPDLVVEILSEHTKKKDLQDKFSIYEESGVKEYWITMPEQKLVEVFVLENQKYRRIQTYVHTDVLLCETLPGLEVDLNEVFNGIKD